MKPILITMFLLSFVSMAQAEQAKLNGPSPKNIPTLDSSRTKPEEQDQAASDEALIDRYFESLNEPDDKRRLVIEKEIWTNNAKNKIPGKTAEGLDAIDAMAKDALVRFPNARVRRTTKIERLGDILRYGFLLSENDGKPLVRGEDICIVADGKLQSVVGFFDWITPSLHPREDYNGKPIGH